MQALRGQQGQTPVEASPVVQEGIAKLQGRQASGLVPPRRLPRRLTPRNEFKVRTLWRTRILDLVPPIVSDPPSDLRRLLRFAHSLLRNAFPRSLRRTGLRSLSCPRLPSRLLFQRLQESGGRAVTRMQLEPLPNHFCGLRRMSLIPVKGGEK